MARAAHLRLRDGGWRLSRDLIRPDTIRRNWYCDFGHRAWSIVAFGIKSPAAVAMGVVGLFAIFHGHAHGSEMPMDASGVEYGIGFMLATALLHAIGIGIGFLIGLSSKRLGDNVYRVAGGLASIAGVAFLSGYL